MHLAQSTRKSSNGESLLGLVDGAQAIVMTLLVIELPVLIIELFEHQEIAQQLYFGLTMDIFGYFLAALIIYDIWSIQKSLFLSTQSSTSQNLACISTLWLSTLIPPMLYIGEHFAQSRLGESIAYGSTNNTESLIFRTITISIVLIIHLILLVFSKKGDNAIDTASVDYDSKLLQLRVTALLIIVPLSFLLGLIGKFGYLLIPFIIFVPFIFVPMKPLRKV
ncbi:TMEM175 family protein [Synechococcus sp. AH-558-M21]|nr:TMEM175 family protein [Synechococcus sp. AH-558-M21]